MKLMGAKEFLKTVKPGTLFFELWMSHEKDCFEIIKDFENGVNLLDKYGGELLIYGNNAGSLTFLKSEKDELLKVNGRLFQKVGFDKEEEEKKEEKSPDDGEEEISVEDIVDERGELI
jgi:hypothetical protein